MKLAIYLAACGLIVACSSNDTTPSSKPSTVYEQYNDKIIQGISYEEEKSYFTDAKQAEIEQKIPQYMQQMKKNREQVIQMYQSISQSVARCKKIRLLEERIDGNTAYLSYEQTDICNPGSSHLQKQSVVMHNEQGWKIHQVEIAL
ncbi:hypothetical protein [Alkanindiges illinoisensis]|uniref:DUF4878 domain-containing protein n=1 Tax=Alkanindiges illinoisensis TaxID=197183 RepID=A0A4Y7XDS3_9GAMM|nr:hypothetical protein [Alkanindiges illinoisensis]TEU28647.1 hypothetical protein E2B99_05235 [Alkanindiges illinoisensis]